MREKVFGYLALVLGNWWLVLGMAVGYVGKAYFGGRMISLVTGMLFGFIIHEVLKWVSWR